MTIYQILEKIGGSKYTIKQLREKIAQIVGQNLHLISSELYVKDIIRTGVENHWLMQEEDKLYFVSKDKK